MEAYLWITFLFLPLIRSQSPEVDADDLHVFMRRQCPVGYFGFQCRFSCRCRANDDCNKVTGTCPRGCAHGYWGPGCQLSNRCYYNGQKRSYMGAINRTREGLACQAWGVQFPHDHNYVQSDFPDGRYPDDNCRTTPDSSMPWCYTTDAKKRWSYCDITNCVCPAGLFGHNCAKMCHCKERSEKCDSLQGMCKSGCDQGWDGFDCQTPAACPPHRYGWSCESECKCRSSTHCHRFTGPTESCQCRPGFFNPPHCEPVTKPRIVEFTNRQVNPGQPSEFNCTVSAFPTPEESEIRLLAPQGRSVSVVRSVELPDYSYTRMNTFLVDYIQQDERYTCFVQGTAGTTSLTAHAKVFELPRLNAPPGVVHGSITANNATIEWRKWNPERGDPGNPEILWYSVHVRSALETAYRVAGIVYHTFCQDKCRYTLTGLQPNTRYALYLSVRREGKGGDGPPGPIIHLTTKCAAPNQPPGIETLTAELEHNTSVPLTRLIIRWNDPPRDSISCNRIAKYVVELAPPPGQGDTRTWELPSGTNRVLSVPGLQPFTEYCVSLYLQTDAGFSSPRSDQACIVTPQTTPAAPVDLTVLRTSSTSVTFSWSRPEPARGNISLYRVLYWPLNATATKRVDWRSNNRYVEYTLPGLRPLTTYQLQVQAVNEAGTGEGTPVVNFMTLEDVPGPVRSLHNVSRTQHSIRLEWQPPSNPGGKLLNYEVSCEMVKTLIGGQPVTHREQQVGAGSNREVVSGLSPATLYNCSVRASTAKGPGQPASVLAWTEAEEPRTPITPVIKSVTDTTVTLDIHHSGDLAVSFYRVVVERSEHPRGTERRRRYTPSHLHGLEVNFQTAAREGLPAYVTAQLPRQRVGGAFTVGDNETYDGFFNGPLQRHASYVLWLVAFSSVDGTQRESYAKTESPVIARAMTAPPPSSHVPVIVGVLIVFILLILTFAVLLIVWRRRHLTSEREKSELPSFGPTILPEPDSSPPPTPISEGACLLSSLDHVSTEAEPLLEASSQRLQDTEPVYSNLGVGLQAVPAIKVEDLWDYIRNNKSNDMEGLRREYRMLPAGLIASCEVARKEENKLKNRYGNIIAYDHTRVVLDPEDGTGDPHDDYINANYIDGYSRPRAYIAAQGPNTPTLQDVWRMVWRENSKTLIMLTNLTETGKKKCEQYWPDEEEGCRQYGPIAVQLLDTDELPDFTVRTFLLTKGGQSKYLKQFHFTTWPDHGVPRFGHSLLLFRQKIRAYDNLDAGPVIVHCSAGVGRTGTYIAVDTQLERARAEGVLDVYNTVRVMRQQRVNMVQSFEQYVFVYDSLLEALICGDTTVSSHAFPELFNELCLFDPDIGKTKLEEQFEILKLLSTTIERDESTTALRPENIFKNRCKNIVPANRCRPYLMTPVDGSNDYINAVFLNCYRRRDGLLVTQMPLPNTVTDFWRLVHDHNSHTIVMLNDLDTKDETCHQYWTEDTCGSVYGPFLVETTAQIISDPAYTVRDFTLTNTINPAQAPRHIRQFHFHRWAEGAAVPPSARSFLLLSAAVWNWNTQTGHHPITIHCMNGASRSGLLCAVLYILERLLKDKEVDVFQAVKQMRLNRSQFIDTLEQYRFCHDILLEFLANPDSLGLSPLT